jgi:hypothetical protein
MTILEPLLGILVLYSPVTQYLNIRINLKTLLVIFVPLICIYFKENVTRISIPACSRLFCLTTPDFNVCLTTWRVTAKSRGWTVELGMQY